MDNPETPAIWQRPSSWNQSKNKIPRTSAFIVFLHLHSGALNDGYNSYPKKSIRDLKVIYRSLRTSTGVIRSRKLVDRQYNDQKDQKNDQQNTTQKIKSWSTPTQQNIVMNPGAPERLANRTPLVAHVVLLWCQIRW